MNMRSRSSETHYQYGDRHKSIYARLLTANKVVVVFLFFFLLSLFGFLLTKVSIGATF